MLWALELMVFGLILNQSSECLLETICAECMMALVKHFELNLTLIKVFVTNTAVEFLYFLFWFSLGRFAFENQMGGIALLDIIDHLVLDFFVKKHQ